MIECSLSEGVDIAYSTLITVSERPIMAAIFGIPNSGKSHFMKQLGLKFPGTEVYTGSGSPSPAFFENLLKYPCKPVLLFHCGWYRIDSDGYRESFRDLDPNVLAERILKKHLHLNIAIYNPELGHVVTGEYDILIRNADSTAK